jgi:hypothetical protein
VVKRVLNHTKKVASPRDEGHAARPATDPSVHFSYYYSRVSMSPATNKVLGTDGMLSVWHYTTLLTIAQPPVGIYNIRRNTKPKRLMANVSPYTVRPFDVSS